MADDTPINDSPNVDTVFQWVHLFYRTLEFRINDQIIEIRVSIRTPPAPAVSPAPPAPPVPVFIFTILNEPRK